MCFSSLYKLFVVRQQELTSVIRAGSILMEQPSATKPVHWQGMRLMTGVYIFEFSQI